jgi:hypothetical protein
MPEQRTTEISGMTNRVMEESDVIEREMEDRNMTSTPDTGARPIADEDLSIEAVIERLPWLPELIAAYRNSANIRAAYQAAGTDRRSVMIALDRYPQLSEPMDDAAHDAVDILRAEARRRAMAGSDVLMMFVLKADDPEKYGDRVKVDIREETRRVAAEMGLTPEETEAAVAEAEVILRRRREENRNRI